jgi:hypothetical protein
MLSLRTTVIVEPWYWQFYLKRGAAEWASDKVSAEGYDTRLEVIDGFIFVGVNMYGNPTEVTFEVHDTQPSDIIPAADHVVEVSVAGDGPIGVYNWDQPSPPVALINIDTPPGPLRLRASWTCIAAAQAHPDRAGTSDVLSPERLLFQVWAEPVRPKALLRVRVADHP